MNYHKLSWDDLYHDCLELCIKHKLHHNNYDQIVSISRGGDVAARTLSDFLALKVSHITIATYHDLKQTEEPEIEQGIRKSIEDKRILLVDEVADTGKTFDAAIEYLKSKKVKDVKTFAPYIKPYTPKHPDYWLREIDAWIIFPYQLFETYSAFFKELKDEEKAYEKMLEVGISPREVDLLRERNN